MADSIRDLGIKSSIGVIGVLLGISSFAIATIHSDISTRIQVVENAAHRAELALERIETSTKWQEQLLQKIDSIQRDRAALLTQLMERVNRLEEDKPRR